MQSEGTESQLHQKDLDHEVHFCWPIEALLEMYLPQTNKKGNNVSLR